MYDSTTQWNFMDKASNFKFPYIKKQAVLLNGGVVCYQNR